MYPQGYFKGLPEPKEYHNGVKRRFFMYLYGRTDQINSTNSFFKQYIFKVLSLGFCKNQATRNNFLFFIFRVEIRDVSNPRATFSLNFARSSFLPFTPSKKITKCHIGLLCVLLYNHDFYDDVKSGEFFPSYSPKKEKHQVSYVIKVRKFH